jgi:hypothetical protein
MAVDKGVSFDGFTDLDGETNEPTTRQCPRPRPINKTPVPIQIFEPDFGSHSPDNQLAFSPSPVPILTTYAKPDFGSN